MSARQVIGVTVLPEYIQTESIDGVLTNLIERAHATAVSVSPSVMAPADATTGVREPPSDASAGGKRMLDRPLWGKSELFVRTAPSFVPDRSFYRGLRYQPAEPDELTRHQGHLVGEFIRAAKDRGLKVYHQVQAAIPPGYRVQFGGPIDDDIPRLPDGERPRGRVDSNGSLASPHIRAYAAAMTRDILAAYPEIDGLRIDWPEYPPYTLDSAFLDFGPHAELAAKRLGFNFERMREDAQRLHSVMLGGLDAGTVRRLASGTDAAREVIRQTRRDYPGLAELLRFKAVLAAELVDLFHRTLAEAGRHVELFPSLFPPPWSALSGGDPEQIGPFADAIGLKLYTMHWPMIIRFYAEAILEAEPALDRADVMRALAHLFDVADGRGERNYTYPGPNEPHLIGHAAMAAKVTAAQTRAQAVPVIPIVHGYGPADDFERRLRTAAEAADGNVWINRYGYLSDEKLELIGRSSG